MSLRFRRLAPAADVLAQTVAGESVLLDLKSEKYFGLNEVGTRVWTLLHETEDVKAVRDRLLEEYAVAADQLDADLNDLLGRLLAAGLVTSSSSEPKGS